MFVYLYLCIYIYVFVSASADEVYMWKLFVFLCSAVVLCFFSVQWYCVEFDRLLFKISAHIIMHRCSNTPSDWATASMMSQLYISGLNMFDRPQIPNEGEGIEASPIVS